ncbi:hypothetical protein GGS26DRAFT_576474 [Hypomontagnella submonticulosa]|nr:hypothetical protein GGS26DRAFT_576474 [Hypomontagnella submonticulosa]
MGKLSPPNPRNYLPSRAHPEHRSRRKELEKEHPFGWTEPLVLGMLGIGLAWNIEKQVQKHEERKDREEQEAKEKEERRRRRRERQIRDGTFDPANHDRGSESMSRSSAGRSREDRDRQREKERRGDRRSSRATDGSERSRSVARDTVDFERGRRDRGRVQSVDMGRYNDYRNLEDGRYYDQPRYDRRDDDGRADQEYRSRGHRRDSF